MKMNMAKRIIAIVLSVLMLMSALPMAALAESVNNGDILGNSWYQEILDKAVAKYYEKLMACTTYEQVLEAFEDRNWNHFEEFINNLLDEDETILDEHRQILFDEFVERTNVTYMDPIVNFTNVADFMKPVKASTASTYSRSFNPISRSVIPNNGLVVDKTASGPDSNGNYKITLETYVTGSVTATGGDPVPCDIVLVLDQSGSMKYCINCGSESFTEGMPCKTITSNDVILVDTPSTSEVYYIRRNNSYRPVYYCPGYDSPYDSPYGSYYDCEAGWYEQAHSSNSHYGTRRDQQDYPFYSLKPTVTAHKSRLNAIKEAVEGFADDVAEKAAGEDKVFGTVNGKNDDVKHRVAIVGFASESGYNDNTEILTVSGTNSGSVGVAYNSLNNTHYASALQDMTSEAGRTMVDNAWKALAANGATEVDLGLEMATKVFANAVDDEIERTRVVIVFTDGTPTTGSSYEEAVANRAIANAKTLKSSTYDATVYSIGVFAGANGSIQNGLPGNNGTGSNRENRFMHLVSSNYPNATDMNTTGDKNSNLGPTDSYYLSASNTETLNDIFNKISQKIETGQASATLGTETVINDIITPYFKLPDGATTNDNDISVKVAKHTGDNANGSPIFGTPTATPESNSLNGVRVTIGNEADGDANSKSINITGYDFTGNYVVTLTNDGTTSYNGEKMVITFDVVVEPGFLGGNGVLTNESDGVYRPDDKGNLVLYEPYPDPAKDVATKTIETNVVDGHTYLYNTIDVSDLITSTMVGEDKYFTYEIAGDTTNTKYNIDGINNAYVDIVYTFTDANGKIATYTIPAGQTTGTAEYPAGFLRTLTADTTYTVTCTVTPTTEGTAVQTSFSDTATVYVHNPIVTFKDSAVKYNSTISEAGYDAYYAANNLESIQWYNTATNKYHTEVTMIGGNPDFKLTYAIANYPDKMQHNGWLEETTVDGAIVVGNMVVGEKDVDVQVTAKIGTTDVTDYTTTQRMVCPHADDDNLDTPCGHANQLTSAVKMGLNPEFVVHIWDVLGNLYISKDVAAGRDEKGNFFELPSDARTREYEFTVTLTAVAGETLLQSYKYDKNGGKDVTGGSEETLTLTLNDAKTVGVGKIYLKDLEYVLIKDLPSRAGYSVVETVPPLYIMSFDTGYNVNEDPGVIEPSKTDILPYINTYSPAALEIKKVITDADANSKNHVFAFDVSLPAGTYKYSDGTVVEFVDNDTTDGKDPVVRVYITDVDDENSKTINLIKRGSPYSVTEVSLPTGYEISGGSGVASGTLNDALTTVTVTNKYNTNSLTIQKDITGEASGDTNITDDVFEVKVSKLPVGTYPIVITGTVIGKDGNINLTNNTLTVSLAEAGKDTEETFYITGESTIEILRLPVGAEYAVQETAWPAAYTPAGLTGGVAPVTSGTISKDAASAVTVSNTYNTGTLTISKTVPVNFVPSQNFTFTVNLPDGTYPAVIAGSPKTIIVTNGVAKINGITDITLRDGQSAVISSIPVGASYTVKETALNLYDTTVSQNGGASASEAADGTSGTMDEAEIVAYTNTHKTGVLKVTKNVDGAVVDIDESFRIIIDIIYEDALTHEFDATLITDSVEPGVDTKVAFSNDRATYDLMDGQTLIIYGLPATAQYEVTERQYNNDLAYYKPYALSENANGYITAGTTADTAPEVVVTNTLKDGNLVISKQVVTVDDSKYADNIHTDVDFEFTVTLVPPTDISAELVPGGTYGDLTLNTGSTTTGTLTLKHGESATITGLPVGTTYTVVETAEAGYENISKTGDTGTIEADSNATAEFTNKYLPGDLTISKTVSRGESDDIPTYVASEFSFTVTLKDVDGNSLNNVSYKIVDKDTGAVKRSGLTISDGGVIKLNAGEVQGNEDVLYGEMAIIENLPPETIYTVTETIPTGFELVSVPAHTDNKITGEIDAGSKYNAEGFNDALAFTNTYTPAALKILKVIEGDDHNTANDVFSFRIKHLPAGTYPISINKTKDGVVTGDVTGEGIIIDGNNESFVVSEVAEGKVTEEIIYIHGEADISINQIPLNNAYEVEEFNLPTGYELKSGESLIRSGTLWQKTDETVDLIYTNVYSTSSLKVEKEVTPEHDNAALDDFKFQIELFKKNSDTEHLEGTFYYTGAASGSITNGIGEVTLKHGQSIVINKIPKDANYKVTEIGKAGYYGAVSYYNGNTKSDEDYSYGTISVGTQSVAKVVNSYQSGELEIVKTVDGKLFNADEEFTFTVNIPAGTYAYTKTGDDTKYTISDGETLTLKPGQTATITDLPVGEEYEVTETDHEVYTLKEKMGDTGRIASTDAQTATASFVNTHDLGELTIKKIVNTVDSDKVTIDVDEKFTFEVALDYGVDANGKAKPVVNGTYAIVNADGTNGTVVFTDGKATVQIGNGETVKFTDLPIGANYTVTEVMTDEQSGLYTLASETGDSGTISATTSAAVFTNTQQLGADVTVTKTVVPVAGFELTNYQMGIKEGETEGLAFTFNVALTPPANVSFKPGAVFEDLVINNDGLTGTLTLTHGGNATISGLPVGTVYTVVETAHPEYAVTVNGAQTNTATGTVSATAETKAFVNTHMPATLKIHKHVLDYQLNTLALDNPAIDNNMELHGKNEFVFWVRIYDGSDEPTTQDFTYKVYNADGSYVVSGPINNGSGLITLTKDITGEAFQYAVIENLLPGMTYRVVERSVVGYVAAFENNDSKLAWNEGKPATTPAYADGSFAAGETEEVVCYNMYNPETLTIVKSIVNEDENCEDDVFKFEVTLPEGLYKITDNKTNESKDFLFTDYNVEMENIMTREFEITGSSSVTISGILQDSSYTVKEITDNLPAYYQLSSEEIESGYVIEGGVSEYFRNTYYTGNLKITKQVEGEDAPKKDGKFKDTFKFTVSNLPNGQYPWTLNGVEQSNMLVVTDGTAVIEGVKDDDTIVIQRIPATTNCTVVEEDAEHYVTMVSVNGAIPPVSETEEGVTVTIPKGTDNDDCLAELDYINSFDNGSLTIVKTFSNCKPEADETFLFKVERIDETSVTTVAEIVMRGSEIQDGKIVVKLTDLPMGTYKVTEDIDWSWRYELDNTDQVQTKVLTPTSNPVFSYKNKKEENKYLDDNVNVENFFKEFE